MIYCIFIQMPHQMQISNFQQYQQCLYQYKNIKNMNILEREKALTKNEQKKDEQKEQLPPQCVETKLIVWEDDQFQQFQIDFLNQVYPQKLNKNTISKGCQFIFHFLSSSLYYWVQFKDPQNVQQGKLSGKDSKFIQTSLNEEGCDNSINYNRWGKYFLKKDDFHKKQVEESKFSIPKGEKIHQYNREKDHFVIYKYYGNNKQFIPYKQRFQVLFLFYIDGVSFVNQQTQQWEYYVIYKQKQNSCSKFVGVLSKYIFKLTSIKQRHRISQVFIMPAYQKLGHAKQMLDLVYSRSLDFNHCFQITTQVPSYQYQCLRDYKQLQIILNKNLLELQKLTKISVKQDITIVQQSLLSKQVLRKLKQQVKLPGNQIQRLVHLLIYARILSQPQNEMSLAYFEQYIRQKIIFNRSAFKSRKKVPHITFQGETPDMKQFFLQKAKQDYVRNQEEIQEILTETLNGFRRVIAKLNKNQLIKFN